MSQFRVALEGADCLVSFTRAPGGVSWRASIKRSGAITREVTGFCPDSRFTCAEMQLRVEQEVREAVAWLEERRTARP